MKRSATVQDVDLTNHMMCNCNISFCVGGNNNALGINRQPLMDAYTPEIDALVVKELTQLSVTERIGIEEEIHGVADAINETPEFLNKRLTAFQDDIEGIRKKPAYERAMFLSPSYVTCPKFRLMFLRADRFATLPAARRFVKFFEAKLDFFGLDKLCKDITWDDLSDDDKAAINTGSIWFSNTKDQTGRNVAWLMQKYETYANYKNQVRNVWYQLMNALEDEDIQRKGFVKVVYNVGMGKLPTLDTDLMFKGAPAIFEALPFRMAAMHYCYDDSVIRPAISTLQHAIGRSGRIRFRAHYGSHLECQYALITFGIPRECIPMSDSGTLQLDRFSAHLEQRQVADRAKSIAAATTTHCNYPVSTDILLGRGRPFQEFPGNVRLALLIDKYRERYYAAGRCDKAIISHHLVESIKSSKGRFLKRSESDGGWVEVSDDVARDKVSHGFRTKTRRNKTTPAATNTIAVPTQARSFFGMGGNNGAHEHEHDMKEAKRLRANNPLG